MAEAAPNAKGGAPPLRPTSATLPLPGQSQAGSLNGGREGRGGGDDESSTAPSLPAGPPLYSPAGEGGAVPPPPGMSAEEAQHWHQQRHQQRVNFQRAQLQRLDFQRQYKEVLGKFWEEEKTRVPTHDELKNHAFPLARIKKIMKADEDVRTISSEAPVLFAKACELFILELTLRAWVHTDEAKRRTLQRNDVAMAICRTDVFDFLIDVMPKEDLKHPLGEGDMPFLANGEMPLYYPVASELSGKEAEEEEWKQKHIEAQAMQEMRKKH
eukprot:CAMPEP_0113886008 /NCGR_PEP_ID=MMETSP0780_2-20120614/11277_1 /TAXON_ID=652834 /ORGANISM="Palpitomonas bilix" /LENGTH=268 /DNA_ID=CAMNT_0000874097 /DNA_START=982 /DNA_END=1788 /DNA_ORIENTATION=- /assembly_acc=CAM_ASM_000599